MMRFVPWLLVALCFVLGVASRSIADSFPVFVPALEQAFSANRGDVTIIYSFALLVGGISGPVNGWILDCCWQHALDACVWPPPERLDTPEIPLDMAPYLP